MLSNNNNYPNGGFERIDKRVVMTKSVVGQTDWGADLTIIFYQALEKIYQILSEMKNKKTTLYFRR